MRNLPTDEWVRTYCGFVMHDEGDHWLLSFWGYPVTTGSEEHCGKMLAELAAELAEAIDARDAVRAYYKNSQDAALTEKGGRGAVRVFSSIAMFALAAAIAILGSADSETEGALAFICAGTIAVIVIISAALLPGRP